MIRLLIFDLDGVLAHTRDLHNVALNMALEELAPDFVIPEHEHTTIYDGITTLKKLEMLVEKGLDPAVSKSVFALKQRNAIKAINRTVNPDPAIRHMLSMLRDEGYRIYIASNSSRMNVITVVYRLGLSDLAEVIFTGDDIDQSKPNPEIYLRCMVNSGFGPNETLIFEDSMVGRQAATRSGAHVAGVDRAERMSYEFVKRSIMTAENKPFQERWKAHETIVLIPMAGAGNRFQRMGFPVPKPLIDVDGKPMVQAVVDSMNIDADFIYIVQKAHYEKYNLHHILNLITPNCRIVQVDGITEGAACTTLLAKPMIDMPTKHLAIVNSDNIFEWNSHDFFYRALEDRVDGSIVTFRATDPKWSFARVEDKLVREVAEKRPISDRATAGLYYWDKGSDYVRYAEQMIAKNIRVNNEFYVCPVYNEAIADGKRISAYDIPRMWGVGTPEDLETYLKRRR